MLSHALNIGFTLISGSNLSSTIFIKSIPFARQSAKCSANYCYMLCIVMFKYILFQNSILTYCMLFIAYNKLPPMSKLPLMNSIDIGHVFIELLGYFHYYLSYFKTCTWARDASIPLYFRTEEHLKCSGVFFGLM